MLFVSPTTNAKRFVYGK